MDINIRNAVIATHGGFENATDDQIMTLWRALPADQKKQLLATKKKEKPNAPSNRPKSDV